jgi:8-oxo-dGTP pyrophosphatase MutT (NUDIX family)
MSDITARPAATIVVIREASATIEILMLRRSSRVANAPGAHVFPGGAIDEVDHKVVAANLVGGLSAPRAAGLLATDQALAYFAAALRELFEESGLLLARHHPSGAAISPEEARQWRHELRHGDLGWLDLLRRENVLLDVSEVAYLAHWVTPVDRPQRFDTRFFIAPAPGGHDVIPDGEEIDDAQWSSASDALARVARGEWTMLPPTRHTLGRLRSATSVVEALEMAKLD